MTGPQFVRLDGPLRAELNQREVGVSPLSDEALAFIEPESACDITRKHRRQSRQVRR